MTITYSISRQKLETAIFNEFQTTTICEDTPIIETHSSNHWLSGVALQSVSIREGAGTKSEQRTVRHWGESSAGNREFQNFTLPALFVDLEYEVKTISDHYVNATQYEKEQHHTVTVRMQLEAAFSGGIQPYVSLRLDSVLSSTQGGIGDGLEQIFDQRYPWASAPNLFLPMLYDAPNVSYWLLTYNEGFVLSDDGQALVIRLDLFPSKASMSSSDQWKISEWEDFYNFSQSDGVTDNDISVTFDPKLLEAELEIKLQNIVSNLKNFSVSSISADWESEIEGVPIPDSYKYDVMPTSETTGRIEGEFINTCLWWDFNYYVEVTNKIRMLSAYEDGFDPGRIVLEQELNSDLTGMGKFENLVCGEVVWPLIVIALSLPEILALGEFAAIIGPTASIILMDEYYRVDEFEVEGHYEWHADIVAENTVLGKVTLSEIEVDNSNLQMLFDTTATTVPSGTPQLRIETGPWHYRADRCSMAPRDQPSKIVTIHNDGTAPLSVCGIQLISQDPSNVYSNTPESGFVVEPGKAETFAIKTRLPEDASEAPYDATYRLVTNVGPRLITVDQATGLSESDYEEALSKIPFDICLDLESWTWNSWLGLQEWVPKPPGGEPLPWKDRPALVQYIVNFRTLPADTSVLLSNRDGRTAVSQPINGDVAVSLTAESDRLADSCFLKLEGEEPTLNSDGQTEQTEASSPIFGVRRLDWYLVDEYELGTITKDLIWFEDNLWTVINKQLLSLSVADPTDLNPSFISEYSDVRQIVRDHGGLLLLRDESIEIYRQVPGRESMRTVSWDHDGFDRFARSDEYYFGLDSDRIAVMERRNGKAPLTRSEIVISDLADIVTIGSNYVAAASTDGVYLLDVSDASNPEVVDFQEMDSVVDLSREGRRLLVWEDESTRTVFVVNDQELVSVGVSSGNPTPWFAHIDGRYRYSLSPDGSRVQSYRVAPWQGVEPVNENTTE
ncbi:hypothetical protein [Natrinema caseinilyticum]|uniref:COG1470 family protein n=1 Tax=Natrinema caseinilyticum TaxID=2961570 RepID=UPI0020C1F0C1|nr:hypothetical protein [Natrinema caseinilyticum]